MKLNADILFYELSQTSFCQVFGAAAKSTGFSHPEPFVPGLPPPRRDVLYVCAPEDLDGETGEGAFVCAGKPRSLPRDSGLLVLSVEGTGPQALFRRVAAVFRKYADWDGALLAALSGPEPIKAMVRCSELLFKNPISVMGCNFHMLVPPPEVVEDYLSRYANRLDERGFLPLQVVNYFKNDPYYNEINVKRGAFLYHSELMPSQNLCVNLFRNNELIARIVVFEIYNLLRPFDGLLLEHLARYMEPSLSFSEVRLMPDLRGLRGFLLSALAGRTDRSSAEAALGSRGWSDRDSFLWLHLLQTEPDVKNKTAYYTCIQIERLFPQACALEHDGGISVLVNLTAARETAEEYGEKFQRFSQKGGFPAGASNAFVGMAHLADFHRQAQIAARAGREQSSGVRLCRFVDAAVHYLLQGAVGDLPALLCCHPAVQRLAAYDGENGTQYIKTLGRYLENQMNIIETARQLFIHRSTMIYRLGRIRELGGIDWADKEQIFYLILSLRLLSDDFAPGEKTPAADAETCAPEEVP